MQIGKTSGMVGSSYIRLNEIGLLPVLKKETGIFFDEEFDVQTGHLEVHDWHV
ncbi:hypothetical protein [Bacillus smithii]|uniref:hypothetical protein n=1 Tax=Bacillus smithii TaxID=1479 RepID=UPI002E251C22|nr:hypothetical protein [Bacillus smithii]MED1454854.1 hypothetical protein [Bacillus smithii]